MQPGSIFTYSIVLSSLLAIPLCFNLSPSLLHLSLINQTNQSFAQNHEVFNLPQYATNIVQNLMKWHEFTYGWFNQGKHENLLN